MSGNADQIAFWSEQAGAKWVAAQAEMDDLLAPVLDLVLQRAALEPGQNVLDIGCGAGTSTRAAAARVAPGGSALGVDVSAPLLSAARAQAGHGVAYLEADAQVHRFEATGFDALISRFGVMFFDAPVAAFTNLHAALRPGATLTCAAWGAAPANPYFMVPAAVARARFGPMPKVDRSKPGPFAFEDTERVSAILGAAGFSDASVTAVEVLLPVPHLARLSELMLQIGPAESALRYFNGDAADRAALQTGLMEALSEYEKGLPALINLVEARA